MTMIKVHLGDADRADYGAPEELTVDVEALKDMRASEHQAIDEEMGMALSIFISLMEDGLMQVAYVGRVAAWLGLRNAGVTVKWADFDPRLNRATFTVERDNPPAGGPSGPSSEEDSAPATSSKPSNRSSASKRTSPQPSSES